MESGITEGGKDLQSPIQALPLPREICTLIFTYFNGAQLLDPELVCVNFLLLCERAYHTLCLKLYPYYKRVTTYPPNLLSFLFSLKVSYLIWW